MTEPVKGFAILDTQPKNQSRWQLVNGTTRIPKAAVKEVLAADQLLQDAEAVWQQAQLEAEQLKQQVSTEGLQTGLQHAANETASMLAQAQQDAKHFVDQSEERILRIAMALVDKILPDLAQQDVVNSLLASALKNLKTGKFLTVRLHPSNRESVEAFLRNHQNLLTSIDSMVVVDDEQLATFDCVVESELGRLEAGLHQQMATILAKLNS